MSEFLLDSIEVTNYRCFEHLTVKKFGRVNLIVGKNNVGKTAFLEALWIYAANLSNVIGEILSSRDEDKGTKLYGQQNRGEHLQKHLFFKRLPANEDHKEIAIKIGSLNDEENYVSYVSTFRGTSGVSFSAGRRHKKQISNEFIETGRLDKQAINILWDKIESTPKEAKVVNALRLMLPKLIKVHPKIIRVEGSVIETVILAQIEGEPEPLPLKSFGEGMNRLFEIALTLVKCENGILLIDEIEIGLHYSVLSDIWRLIFNTARDLNVQVFATTHSRDCIEAFAQVANESSEEGQLIRLERNGEMIVAKSIEENMLIDAINYEVEVR